MFTRYRIPVITVFSVLLIDQAIKIFIKLNYKIGDQTEIADWFFINFTENPGMAFGFEFGGEFGKLALSIFRILACIGGVFYIRYAIKQKEHPGFIFSVSLILAGALGNIFDSVFYGIFFTESDQMTVARLVAPGQGYESLLHGRVVDMFYFPIIEGTFPDWFPIWAGEPFEFFRPVFNFADASISIGVIIIILFQKRFSKRETVQQDNSSPTEQVTQTESTATGDQNLNHS